MTSIFFPHHIIQVDSMLPCVCSVIGYGGVTHSSIASCAAFLLLLNFDVLCDQLLNGSAVTWNLFVNFLLAELTFFVEDFYSKSTVCANTVAII